MSPEHQELAKETARLAMESIQRDKMLIEFEYTIKSLQQKFNDVTALLDGYDGHYDRETETGDSTELANLIDVAVEMLKKR